MCICSSPVSSVCQGFGDVLLCLHCRRRRGEICLQRFVLTHNYSITNLGQNTQKSINEFHICWLLYLVFVQCTFLTWYLNCCRTWWSHWLFWRVSSHLPTLTEKERCPHPNPVCPASTLPPCRPGRCWPHSVPFPNSLSCWNCEWTWKT